MSDCPICKQDAHPAMAKRYDGCCNDMCWEVFAGRQEISKLTTALEKAESAEQTVVDTLETVLRERDELLKNQQEHKLTVNELDAAVSTLEERTKELEEKSEKFMSKIAEMWKARAEKAEQELRDTIGECTTCKKPIIKNWSSPNPPDSFECWKCVATYYEGMLASVEQERDKAIKIMAANKLQSDKYRDALERMKPKRIQRKRTKGWRMPEGVVYCGRPTEWGNPFKVDDNHPAHGFPMSAQETVDLFKKACADETILDHVYENWLTSRGDDYWDMEEWLKPLKGKDLACWCPLDQPCHVDILLKMAND